MQIGSFSDAFLPPLNALLDPSDSGLYVFAITPLPSDELFPSLFVVPFLLSKTLKELEILVAEVVEVVPVVYWREVTAGALALDDAISSSSYSTVWISKPVLSVVGSKAGRPHLV